MHIREKWYFVSIIREVGGCIHLDGLEVDAVRAESQDTALTLARLRNPLRPGQRFCIQPTKGLADRQKARGLYRRRCEQVDELRDLVEKS